MKMLLQEMKMKKRGRRMMKKREKRRKKRTSAERLMLENNVDFFFLYIYIGIFKLGINLCVFLAFRKRRKRS